MVFAKQCILVVVLIMIAGCGGMMDDLLPSGSDKHPIGIPGSTGPLVGQNAPDFILSDTLGNSVSLTSAVMATGVQGAVLYFTMWCPICDMHMNSMRYSTLPAYPNVRVFLVDYISGSVVDSRNAELQNGYGGSGFTVLADTQQSVLGLYQATMGTTVVVDRTGVIQMNEDYKDGARLQAALTSLP
jgi:peroxiredoxin